MKIYRSLKISVNALFSNKLRTILALMGISIGVAAVIIMVAIGQGTQESILQRIKKMGTNILTIKAGKATKLIRRERQFLDFTSLKPDDCTAIADTFLYVIAAAPIQDRDLRVKFGNISTNSKIIGTTEKLKDIRNFKLAQGRFLTEEENKAGMRVAVIGQDIYKNIFKSQYPIGEMIRINKIPFEVIGVLQPVGGSSEGANEDIHIYIPIKTALRRVFNIRHLKLIYVQVSERGLMNRAENEIANLLRQRHRLVNRNKSDDFTIRNQVKVIKMETESTSAFTFLISGIAAISLLVGGIGILAIMLLAVKERTNEIGLRRAIGANSRDILLQFLLEALILGLMGGFVGIFIGFVSIWAIDIATVMNTTIPFVAMILAIFFSLSVGLFFGVYPARRAAQLDPIEALRAE